MPETKIPTVPILGGAAPASWEAAELAAGGYRPSGCLKNRGGTGRNVTYPSRRSAVNFPSRPRNSPSVAHLSEWVATLLRHRFLGSLVGGFAGIFPVVRFTGTRSSP